MIEQQQPTQKNRMDAEQERLRRGAGPRKCAFTKLMAPGHCREWY